MPLIMITAILIWIFLGPPVLFNQVRPGLHGKPFTIHKFRTMTIQKSVEDCDEKRLTTFGKFIRRCSLDELPQLFNVLKGDMSFVGPRPLLMEYLPLYNEEQNRRHDVKPGITGWSQVNGRNSVSWEQKFKMDIWYVEHRSFFLDMKILYKTILRVFQAKDINQEGRATIDVFRGNKERQ